MRPVTFPPLAFNAWLRWDVVERVVRRLPTVSSVLEIGAGEGAVATRLASRFEYVGLEPDPTSCARAQSRLAKLGRGTVLCAEASSLDRDRSFDLVCAFEVLEHIENDAGALLDWKRLLRKGGLVLLSVPQDPRRWGPADEKAGHFRRYSRGSLSRLFRQTGFEEVEVLSYGMPLGYILEAGRNMLARRGGSAGSLADRTAASGRYFQPPDSLGWATRGLTAPFRVLQRPFLASDRGTGLLALARDVEGGRAAESRPRTRMADAGMKASAPGGGDERRVVFFGTYDVHQHPRVRALQEGLAAHGYEVLECNAPLGFGTDWRVRTVRHPWLAPLLVARLATAWSRLVRKARMLPPAQAVIVPYMGHFDVHVARRLWPSSPIFLDHFVFGRDTAVDRGATWRPLLAALDRIDRAALGAADVPFVDTEGHLDLLPERSHSRAVVVPVGAPDHWFLAPRKLEGSASLRVIFYGTYAPLQGAPVIGEAIRLLAPRHEAISFTMVGHGQDLTRTRSLAAANQAVTWRDWVEHDELPGLVQGHDVCLGIFGTTPKGLRVVPNKVYQGAAAGCAIVTSDTQAQRGALLDAALYVPPGDARALADQLLRLADDRDRVWALREAAYRRADEAFRPGAIVASLRQRLEEIEPGWSRE